MNDAPKLVYAGDVTPQQAWHQLEEDSDVVLIDVRTDAEWQYVGLPDIASLNKDVIKLAWKVFPSMTVNATFVDVLSQQVPDRNATLLFLCRSGVRSREAAAAMTASGYSRCFNILEGFEGDHDESKHRGMKGGWKVHSLPWTQG